MRAQVFSILYRVIEAYGYSRYDGPLLEPVEIYEAKSGEELVRQQLYQLTDRGGRRLALRPEMTPTVARMVAAHAKGLHFPLRWYSHVNCHRYERPQRGRLREHWQINVDIFGSESPEAEVEIFELIHRMFAALGARREDYIVRAGDRILLEAALKRYAAIDASLVRGVFGVIDRWEKVPPEETREALEALGLDEHQVERIRELVVLGVDDLFDTVSPEVLARSNLARLFKERLLDEPLQFDPLIIRGFEYYTSTVFEVFDVRPENRRSLFGGGRYDNLVGLFSAERIPGIGFGMGDVTLFDFLELHGLLPAPDVEAQVCVIPLTGAERHAAREIAAELRAGPLRVIQPLEQRPLGKELRRVAKQGVRFAVIVGTDELARGAVILRDMRRSVQEEVARKDLAAAIATRWRAAEEGTGAES